MGMKLFCATEQTMLSLIKMSKVLLQPLISLASALDFSGLLKIYCYRYFLLLFQISMSVWRVDTGGATITVTTSLALIPAPVGTDGSFLLMD